MKIDRQDKLSETWVIPGLCQQGFIVCASKITPIEIHERVPCLDICELVALSMVENTAWEYRIRHASQNTV